MEYTIEENITVPKQYRPGRPAKYPWKELGISMMMDGELIGPAFFIPGGKIHIIGTIAGQFGKRNNMKFTCRTVDGGVQVWRIA